MYTTTDRTTLKSSSCADIAAPGYRNIESKRERNKKQKISRACQGKYPSRLWMTKFLELWGKESRVIKSIRLPEKITAYLVSISWLLCLAFLYGCRFLNKISLDWPLTLTTEPSRSKLSDMPEKVT